MSFYETKPRKAYINDQSVYDRVKAVVTTHQKG